jgi:hypothetical protein
MSYKVLEVSSGNNMVPKKYELVEVQQNIFMLKSRESTAKLRETLNKWLQKNYSITELDYSDMLYNRSSSMRHILSEGSSRDVDIGSMTMTESRVALKNIHDGPVFDNDAVLELMAGPRRNLENAKEQVDLADNLFVGGHKKLLQWSIGQEKAVKDYGDLMNGDICSMVKTSDKKYLFVSDN